MKVEAYEFPEALWYHRTEHLWLRPGEPNREGGREVLVGLDAIGVEALGEVVYIQLLDPGRRVGRGQAVGSLEAEKMVRPVLAPVSGALVGVNSELVSAPRLLSADPYGRGWLVRIRTDRWEAEAQDLLHGRAAVEAWVRAELEAYEGQR